jgi:arylsulfatase A-like enzyme
MNQRRWLLGLGGLLLAAIVACGIVFWPRPATPNILLITLDTTRADRIGCYGYALAETPTLDHLAQRGVLFERAYAPAPMTAPSHTSMFTGLFPPEHGIWTNAGLALEPDIPVLAELLRRRGYATAAFISSVALQARCGLNRGFEVYDDDLSSGAASADEHGPTRDGKQTVDVALGWLAKRPREAPFFCWVHLFDPHHPYLPRREEFGERFEQRPYDAEIAYDDLQLARLLAALDAQAIRDQTVIVVVGDHGEGLGEHGEQQHGYMLHDSTLRVPLIIADPRANSAGRVSTPVSLVDLFPTLSTFGGVAPNVSADRSLRRALDSKLLSPRICYSQTLEPYQEARWSPLQCLTTERWRYVRTAKPELYDLPADPGELHNLVEEYPEIVSELDDELTQFLGGLKPRTGGKSELSERERQSLESLGYIGAASIEPGEIVIDPEQPDIKDMIVPLNGLFEAQALMEQHDYQKAAERLQPIAESVPNFARARFTLGVCLFKLQRFEDAAKWFEAVLEIDPHYEPAHDVLGYIALKAGDLDSAETRFQRVLELNPASENAHLYLGEIAQKRGDDARALQFYSETLQLNPQNAAARQAYEALRRRTPR